MAYFFSEQNIVTELLSWDVFKINVDFSIFQSYHTLEAGDTQSQKSHWSDPNLNPDPLLHKPRA